MKKIALIFILFISFVSNSQMFEYKEGCYYEQPGEQLKDVIKVEFYNEEYKIYEEGFLCRESKWVREYHRGCIYVPNYVDGSWDISLENKGGYYWTYRWSDWEFCKNK